MHNLHRELAPVSAAAWAQIDAEAARTFKMHLAGRRAVDVHASEDDALAAVGTGHGHPVESPDARVEAWVREAVPLVELRAPFALDRGAVDDVERGARDVDLDPLREAARQLAHVEDRTIFEGYPGAGVRGIRQVCAAAPAGLPEDALEYPRVVAQTLAALRAAGVDGPYAVALGAEPYARAFEASEFGSPVVQHLERLGAEVLWAPALAGAVVLTTRGGDFDLWLGRDLSIGYLDHSDTNVQLYLQETLGFRANTAEAALMLDRIG